MDRRICRELPYCAPAVNIDSMQVGRTEIMGTNMMVMGVDSDIPASVMLKIKAVDGIVGAKLVNFSGV